MRRKRSEFSIVDIAIYGDDVIINDVNDSGIDFDIEIEKESPCG